MKPKRTADLSLFLTVTGLLLASLAFKVDAQSSHVSKSFHEFYEISKDPRAILPKDKASYDGTQAEMNSDACNYSIKMDTLLGVIYDSILRSYSKDTEFIGTLKLAQGAWIKYRDAELLAILGPETPENHGSMDAMCGCEYRSSLDRERIAELLMWLRVDPMNQTGCDTFFPESER